VGSRLDVIASERTIDETWLNTAATANANASRQVYRWLAKYIYTDYAAGRVTERTYPVYGLRSFSIVSKTHKHPSTMTNSEIKNKHLDVDGSDSGSSSGSKANSGRSSPYIREAHQKKHHHEAHKHDHDAPEEQDREDSQARQQRNKHIGRKIQHGLQKSSSRNTGIPLDCYIGLAFRVMKTEEEIEGYRRQVGGMSTSVVDLEKGEQLLTWQAVVSDGTLHALYVTPANHKEY
jgi:hypothetical protein